MWITYMKQILSGDVAYVKCLITKCLNVSKMKKVK